MGIHDRNLFSLGTCKHTLTNRNTNFINRPIKQHACICSCGMFGTGTSCLKYICITIQMKMFNIYKLIEDLKCTEPVNICVINVT